MGGMSREEEEKRRGEGEREKLINSWIVSPNGLSLSLNGSASFLLFHFLKMIFHIYIEYSLHHILVCFLARIFYLYLIILNWFHFNFLYKNDDVPTTMADV